MSHGYKMVHEQRDGKRVDARILAILHADKQLRGRPDERAFRSETRRKYLGS